MFVDRTLAGGEPSVAYALKSGLLVYSSHEGTTHLFSSALPGAPAESGGFLGNYHNQVNIWTSGDSGRSWKLVPFGSATDPFATGFSDPDLTQDANQNIYNTGIDLANDALFSSQDGGRHWLTGTVNCHEGDRPWLAGGGANEVFLSTDTEESGHEIFHSTDAGASCASKAIVNNGSVPGGGTYQGQGKIYYDRTRGALLDPVYYYTSSGTVNGVGIGILPRASSAFSNPAAKFTDTEIAKTTAYAHWPSIAIDSGGNYYIVWDTDDRDTTSANGCPATFSGSESFGSLPPASAATPLANRVMMAYSTDGGQQLERASDDRLRARAPAALAVDHGWEPRPDRARLLRVRQRGRPGLCPGQRQGVGDGRRADRRRQPAPERNRGRRRRETDSHRIDLRRRYHLRGRQRGDERGPAARRLLHRRGG